MEQPPPQREPDILRAALSALIRRLPDGWTVRVDEEVALGGARADAVIEITDPGGARANLVAAVKSQLGTRDVLEMLDQLKRFTLSLPGTVPLVVARYLPAPTRLRLEELGASYADATGNLLVSLADPALFVRDVGAERDPWRGRGRPSGTLTGAPAARVVRALVDYTPPMSVLALIERSGASTSTAYRVVNLLKEEALLDRVARGPIASVDWRRLLERWSRDYRFSEAGTVGVLEPRGLDALHEKLRDRPELGYVVTGSLAAQAYAPYAPPRLAMIFADPPEEAIDELGLRRVESGVNVSVATPPGDFVFERATMVDGVLLAAPSQVAADLLTGPGRSPEEAQELLDWMASDESRWRR